MLPWTLTTALAAPLLDEPLRTGLRADEDVAVVIGIEDYFALPDVPYAKRDAQAIHDLMIYTLGVPSDRVTLLDGAVSREKILSAVAEASARVGPDGTLWFYFAGHGAADPTSAERTLLGADTLPEADSFSSREPLRPA